MTIGGHLRRYAMKLFPRSALFSSSSKLQAQHPPLNSRPQARPPPLNIRRYARPPGPITPGEVASWVAFAVVYNVSMNWLGFHGRQIYQTWNAEKEMRSRLEELDRIKEESPEAYLEMLQDEIRTVKSALSDREGLEPWEAEHYKRKAAVLESKLHEWVEVVDTAPVPVPQG